jgi:hypothetical protein
MKIMQLSRDDIPLVTRGGNKALVDEITAELDQAELQNCVVYVRYGPNFLQRLKVDREMLRYPETHKMLLDDEWWNHQNPGYFYSLTISN